MTKAEIRRAIEGKRLRLHPNGFIQVDVDATRRLHVWPDAPLKDVTFAPRIHSHSFRMSSEILIGQLTNVAYVEGRGGCMYEQWEAREQGVVDTRLRFTGRHLIARIDRCWSMAAGDVYTWPAGWLHDSDAEGLTATLMEVPSREPDLRAVILVPIGQAPLPRSAVAEHPEELWPFIERALA